MPITPARTSGAIGSGSNWSQWRACWPAMLRGRSFISASAPRIAYSPMRRAKPSVNIRTSGTCRGQVGSLTMCSTPAPGLKMAFRFTIRASRSGSFPHIST